MGSYISAQPVSVRSGCLRNVSLLSNIDINNAVNTNTANTAQQTVDKESTLVDNDNELYLAVLTWLYIYYVNCAVNQCCNVVSQTSSPHLISEHAAVSQSHNSIEMNNWF